MKTFGGPAFFLDRNDINTDEIIPAKYLAEISKAALKEHLLEGLLINGVKFDNNSAALLNANVIVTRENFGCGSSREHAVWAFETNAINVIIAQSFARIFRQNMFNCGILAIELDAQQIQKLFDFNRDVEISVNVKEGTIEAIGKDGAKTISETFSFALNDFDKDLVTSGGWLEYAEMNY